MVFTVQSMLHKQLLHANSTGMLSLYTEVVTQLRAKVVLQRATPTQAAGGPNLFDEQDAPEKAASHRQLTKPDLQQKFAKPQTWTPAPAPSSPPPGCRLVEIAQYQCYIKEPMRAKGPFYSDSSRLDDGRAGARIAAAGGSLRDEIFFFAKDSP